MIRLLGCSLLAVTVGAPGGEPKLATVEPVGRIEIVATIDGPMPTGVGRKPSVSGDRSDVGG
jgi:hypothetical protein